MNIRTPSDLFFDQLKDLHSVESQVIDTLPDLADHANHEGLKSLLIDHEGESVRQKQAISGIFGHHGVDPGDSVCLGMRGLIEGGNQQLSMTEDSHVRDLLLIAHCTRINHYEIAAYGITRLLAEHVGFERDTGVLQQSLEEEMTFSRQLAAIASELLDAPLVELP